MTAGVTVDRVLQALRELCPPRYALEGDKTGLQVGQGDRRIERVLATMDLTLAVAEEAVARGVGLVVSHHALIFRPLKDLRTDRFKGRILETLIKNEVAVYVPHTAMDVVAGGMNDHLAASVGLVDPVYLEETGRDGCALIVAEAEDPSGLLSRIHDAGVLDARRLAGRLELVVDARRAHKVAGKLAKLCEAQPMVLPLDAPSTPRGIGRVGRLAQPESLADLARRLKETLGAPGVRLVAEDPSAMASKVAVLGGDGRRFVRAALFAGADALVTGDVDHHTALEARAQGIALLDVGHYASEKQVIPLVAEGLREKLASEPVEILESEVDTQPFVFV